MSQRVLTWKYDRECSWATWLPPEQRPTSFNSHVGTASLSRGLPGFGECSGAISLPTVKRLEQLYRLLSNLPRSSLPHKRNHSTRLPETTNTFRNGSWVSVDITSCIDRAGQGDTTIAERNEPAPQILSCRLVTFERKAT